MTEPVNYDFVKTINVYGADDAAELYELKSHLLQFNTATGVAIVTINDPRRLNAFRLNVHWELHCLLLHLERDDRVRVIVWTGAGDRAFSSGADFAELMSGAKTHVPEHVRSALHKAGRGVVDGDIALKSLMTNMWRFPKPIVCAVNGVAAGFGANFALTGCDLVYATRATRFSFPFVALAICPEMASTYSLTRALGPTRFKELVYTGGSLSAPDAHSHGLLNGVFDDVATMRAAAIKMATKIAAMPSQTSVRLSKQLINRHHNLHVVDALDAENKAFAEAMAAPEFNDAMVAFMARHSGNKKKQRSKL